MLTKYDLRELLKESLAALGGSGAIPAICKYVWDHHEADLRASGDLFFFTWQYDIRWAATMLRKARIMKSAELSPHGIWELTPQASSIAL